MFGNKNDSYNNKLSNSRSQISLHERHTCSLAESSPSEPGRYFSFHSFSDTNCFYYTKQLEASLDKLLLQLEIALHWMHNIT